MNEVTVMRRDVMREEQTVHVSRITGHACSPMNFSLTSTHVQNPSSA